MNATAAWFNMVKWKDDRGVEFSSGPGHYVASPKTQIENKKIAEQKKEQAKQKERWAKQAEAEEKRRAKQQRTKELESADKEEAKNRAAEAAEIKRQKEQDERAKRVKTQQDQAKAKRERDKQKEAEETARQRTAVKEGLERRGAFYSRDKDTGDTGIPGEELEEAFGPNTSSLRRLSLLSGKPRWGQVVRNIAGTDKKKPTYKPPKDMGNIGDFKTANRSRRDEDQVRTDRKKLIDQMKARRDSKDPNQKFSPQSVRLLQSLEDQEEQEKQKDTRQEAAEARAAGPTAEELKEIDRQREIREKDLTDALNGLKTWLEAQNT